MNEDILGVIRVVALIVIIFTVGYQGIIKDHPIERYYISSQSQTECGVRINIVGAQPWGIDKIAYKAKTFEEAIEKVKQLNSTIVKE